jgi:hypothetical protein
MSPSRSHAPVAYEPVMIPLKTLQQAGPRSNLISLRWVVASDHRNYAGFMQLIIHCTPNLSVSAP